MANIKQKDEQVSSSSNIARPVRILRGFKELASALRTSQERIRNMVEEGAPIYFEGPCPKSEYAELWTWYSKRMQRYPEIPVK